MRTWAFCASAKRAFNSLPYEEVIVRHDVGEQIKAVLIDKPCWVVSQEGHRVKVDFRDATLNDQMGGWLESDGLPELAAGDLRKVEV